MRKPGHRRDAHLQAPCSWSFCEDEKSQHVRAVTAGPGPPRGIKIKKQKLHFKGSQIAGRENSHACALNAQDQPHGKREICTSNRMKEKSPPSQEQLSQWEAARAQPMRSHHTWNFQFPPMESAFTTALPESTTETASSLLLWACVWFTVRLHVTNCNS